MDAHAYFDSQADYWHDVYLGTTYSSWHMKERKTIVLALVDQLSQGKRLKLLDLGCGAGFLTQALLQRGHLVTAVDSSENMLHKLSSLAPHSNYPNLEGSIRVAATATGISASQFDGVVCVGVMQYQSEPQELTQEIVRLLKPGGFCIITLPNLLTVQRLLDPVYIGHLFKRLFARRILMVHDYCGRAGFHRIVGNPDESQPYSRKYLVWEARRAVQQHGLHLRQRIAFGFGPLTLMKRPVLPVSFSIHVSSLMTRLSRNRAFRWLAYLANRWVFVCVKDDFTA